MKIQVLLLSFLIAVVLAGCNAYPKETATPDVPIGNLSLDLTLTKKQYKIGEWINAILTLTNTGNESILVKKDLELVTSYQIYFLPLTVPKVSKQFQVVILAKSP